MNAHPHTATPTLSVIDPRALAIRGVGYCRHPDSAGIDPRITRQGFDAAGRLVESWDPRLLGTAAKANVASIYGLNGHALLTDSVDAGWQLNLLDQSGLPCSFWDARGSQRYLEYDPQRRPVAVVEQAVGEAARVVERLTYGGSDSVFAGRNQCGQLIRHDDPAGSQIYPEYGMAAGVLQEERRFLAELEIPDWPLEPEARDELLETRPFITRYTFNPTGELRQQTDAMGNLRTFGYDLAGKPDEAWLQVAGEGKPPKRLVSAIRYNALDQVESETAGNGVVTRVEYAADDGRLLRLQAALGSQKPLQDLNYVYDAVGNIVELQDLAQPVIHFNNQRIDPVNRYRYDSLYQLVEARGWEVSQPSHGPTLPELLPTPLDPNQRRNYTQCFEYDRGGNLITRQHSGAPGFSMFTSARSNRSLAQREDGSLPGEGEIALGFDACGNQRELQRGQAMDWDMRNQLSRVTLVKRETEPDDYESYRYDRPGHRLRKVGFTQSSGRTLRTEVRYLPSLEIHRQADGEEHHVISIEAGRSNVRALHWPQGEHSDQLRYSLSDHLGSSTLELDDEAGVLTQEHYYPFGGTACWAGKSALVAKYKTLRYSNKERDATGLYYYGFRYYAPWLQRWLTPDPAGSLDGLNRYQMVGSNPSSFYDWQGTIKVPVDIFIGDIVSFLAKDIGTGWFEELVWNEEQSTFLSVGPVYGRSLKVFEGERSEWAPSEFGQAITFFRDQNNKLRLFANMHFQHMGIQPGMGLPEFAGVMKRDSSDSSKFIINNHSGHYKPDSSIDVEAMIHEIAPQQQSVRYIPIPESSSFDATLRLDSIDSPEEYSRLVSAFKRDFKGLIVYLKEQGVWDAAKERFGNSEGINIIFKMEETGRTAQQIYDEEDKLRNARVMASSEEPVSNAATTTLPQAQAKPKKRSFFQKLFG
ncbi:RHS repeat-associated core domain protein containing protein [Pseudomonas sp. GM33]|uniref:RHS repeat domain-containing protein n=1 Tax=Pseudomonas sp. GM33 TaxID=1144329 RepID=UPI0002701245|nr:RHS repeat-associated core domain-containing protein [Pseudomonas sp. GM33]EJM48525.1 RHS repeat-associated core domain protein containing protein [Pseudomonas sp. GM33]